MDKKDVQGFISWAREFIGNVQDQKGTDMPSEFWEQLDTLEYMTLRKPEYEENGCVSPCEQGGARCVYGKTLPNEDLHCVVCGWVQ